jgi:hypothetical protein
MKFSINSDFDKLAVKQHIDKLPENKRYTIEITQKRENRTLDQNALYWLWLTCIEQETGNSKEDIHYYCKDNFLPKKEMTIAGEVVYIPESTTKKDTKQFSDYMNEVQVFAASELGIILPDPQDLIFESFYNEYKDRI